MKRIALLFFLMVIVGNDAFLQGTQKEKNVFGSQVSAGIVEGQYGTSFHVETVQGLRYKTWFGGIGAGLDYYYLRSIPLYLSATKFLSERNHSFYVQGNAGVNFVWQRDQTPSWNEVSSEFKPGLYWNGSIGWATGLDRKNSFLFGLGYSYKLLREEKEIAVQCFNPPCQNSVENYRYSLRRLSLKLGWQFNHGR
jgi:hypothetical protein